VALDNTLKLKREKLRLYEEKLERMQCLPHLYAFKKYKWQADYCKARMKYKRMICAANQIGKSSVQIMDRIDIGTDPSVWPELWPKQFEFQPKTRPYSWYLYPNQDTVMSEFKEKWEPYYLPRGKFKEHPVFGWKETIVNKVLKYIEFNSGYKIYFKTYNQNVMDLQSGTVFAIDCDEELPEHLLPELEARLFASDGQMSMVFTATLGQEIWRQTIEGTGVEEKFPEAFKRQVSMYDCLEYEDGSPTPWTKARIQRIERSCKDKNERDRRVYGRFVLDSGLKYPGFDRERNYKPYPKGPDGSYYKGVPKGWTCYGSIDLGSGGEDNHPTAMGLLTASPDFDKLRLIRVKRLDKIETTHGDSYKFYRRFRGKTKLISQCYDHAAKDFGTITTRAGDYFEKAKKDHEIGEEALDTLLKSGTLVIYYDPEDDDGEALKLAREFETLKTSTPKTKAKDDLIDMARYNIMQVPVDWEKVLLGMPEQKQLEKPAEGTAEKERPRDYWKTEEDRQEIEGDIESEFEEWNELY